MSHRVSLAIYRRLSTLYPKAFRAEYGDDLIATFAEQLDGEHGGRVWVTTIRDLVVTVPQQHLEARMRRPEPHTVAAIASCVTVAALVTAFITGTGPPVPFFLMIAVIAGIVATQAWKSARPAGPNPTTRRWRQLLAGGVALLTTVIVAMNVPAVNDRELGGAGWVLMMLSLVTAVVLITVGLTLGIAHRSSRATTAK